MSQVFVFAAPPANWQDFQILIGEIARVKYVSDSVQEYGRPGQTQNGIDIYAVDHFDKIIGIQCKETKKDEGLTKSGIDAEIVKAKKLLPKLDLLILATTERIDRTLQDYVNGMNHAQSEPFKVQIWFWDDVNTILNRSQSVMSSWYESFMENFGLDQLCQHLVVLRTAFDRPAFVDDFLHERNYDEFEAALVDTKALIKTGFLYDRWRRNLVSETVPAHLIGDDKYKLFVSMVESSLEKLYQTFLREKKKMAKNPNQLNESAGNFNILRRPILENLNEQFSKRGLEKIQINY